MHIHGKQGQKVHMKKSSQIDQYYGFREEIVYRLIPRSQEKKYTREQESIGKELEVQRSPVALSRAKYGQIWSKGQSRESYKRQDHTFWKEPN